MRIITITAISASLSLLTACGSSPAGQPAHGADSTGTETTAAASKVPEKRNSVKKEAVAQYSERTDNPLNEWYFSVRLFETPKTFSYLLKMQFEEVRGTDTLQLPDFGDMPEPVIRKGPDRYSCIIGFMDKDKQFREYKKVYVKNDVLKVTTLKYYQVSTYNK